MKKVFLAGIAALAIAGSTVAYAQNRQWFHERMHVSPEDRAAFADARLPHATTPLYCNPWRNSGKRFSFP